MKNTFFSKLTFVLILIFLGTDVMAQVANHVPSDFRGNSLYRRKSNLDGNNVRTTVHNYGVKGADAGTPDEFRFEWPKNTGRQYIYFIQLWMGGEVVDENGEVIYICPVPTGRTDVSGNVSWTNEPVEGFLNPDAGSVARSDEKITWPTNAQGGWADKREDSNDPGWIGSWNGFFGKNIFNADLEMYYKASDDPYHYSDDYTPDSTDITRGGLGFLFDVRAMAWTQVLINDVQFFIFDILNDGTKRVGKTTFTFWMADLIGNNSQDDLPFLDIQTDITFYTDGDRREVEPWGEDFVGLGAIKLLETPGNQVDGIDNDGDADLDQNLGILAGIENFEERAPLFTEEDFDPRTIGPGDKIVLIDSLTFERHIIEYPAGGGTVKSLGFYYDLPPGGTTLLEDTLIDLRDGDLDGVIDETQSLHLERYNQFTGTEVPVRYIDYLQFEIGDTVKRGFIVAGKNAEFSYENVAPMIDESRDDGFDNDGDWDAIQDDVGLDGRDSNEDLDLFADTGEGDGLPTTGSGTDFPGEPNIDKTDVSETDLLGLSGAVQFAAGSVGNWNDDRQLWRKFMSPGTFDVPRQAGEFDLWMTSGHFPIEPGERQRMAISVAMAGGGPSLGADIEEAVAKEEQARVAYESDYQFAKAPLQVTVTAVPGDGKVTLYWDDIAESSIDGFIKRQGGDAEDFEGYRIYRSTDAAFLDPKVITDGKGTPLLLKPIAQFDKADGLEGYHPVPISGVQYYLGDDTGLKHSFIDSNLTNGQRYFYAVTSYDFGYLTGNIPPSESAIRIDVDPEGNITSGTNIAIVRPRAAVAGHIPASIASLEHVSGFTTADIEFEVVDPRSVKEGHTYEITFEDTVKNLGSVTLVTTKNFSLKNVTMDSMLIEKSTKLDGEELPVADGIRLSLFNLPVSDIKLDEENSVWSDANIFEYQFAPVVFLNLRGASFPNDYKLIFGEVGIGTSKDTSIAGIPLPSEEVNFKIINSSDNDTPVEFTFFELNGDDGRFTIDTTNANLTDLIYFLEKGPNGNLIYTWSLILNTLPIGGRNPQAGDTLTLSVTKPFQSKDVFRFTTKGEASSNSIAKSDLKDIRVVPNPYIVTESWEQINPYTSGRGPREIHFINLPKKCTIRIFTVNGELVDKINFDGEAANSDEINGFINGSDSGVNNGTAIWDMLSRDNLEIAYGIYLYHIDAPGVGQKSGTFAIIK
ncbi:MAG: hypothetical protein D8M58_16780 [Calditrichaeota bacterium]|nr:MAG: hypothetical protein DWQ03_11910 [Calditrichota bacterium]MBL1207062.1 hypothetical protein [Calditrichota bacterium]NOG46892.1 hypothetical protein [Calditrichota bacterium]